MVKSKSLLVCVAVIFMNAGCSHVLEGGKMVLGISTQALEKARVDAISRTYVCDFYECYDAILALERQPIDKDKVYEDELEAEEEDDEFGVLNDGSFDVYMKDPVRSYIIVMGVSGNINTTEVGIFLVEHDNGTVTIDVSSLSSTAKRKVSEAVFNALDQQFSVGVSS